MMKRPFLVLKKDCGEAVHWVSDRLNRSGLQVMQTFDLHTSRLDQSPCPCPHHGTQECDCQMVVLLVYDNGSPPASLVAHGHDGQTWFTLVDAPRQNHHSGLAAAIQDALAPHIFTLRRDDLANVS